MADRPTPASRCPSRASTSWPGWSPTKASTPCSSAPPCSPPDVAAGLAARTGGGLNWDLTDLAARRGSSGREAPALQDSVRSRLRLEARRRGSRLVRSGRSSRWSRERRLAELVEPRSRSRSSRRRRDGRPRPRGGGGPVDRGGRRHRRGRSRPRDPPTSSRSSRSSRRPSAARSPPPARSSTPAGTRTRRRSARRARRSRRSSTSPAGSRARSSTRSACSLRDDRRDQQGSQRADLRLLRPRRGW